MGELLQMPPRRRVANRTTADESCSVCADSGLVVVGTDADGADQAGPCPLCERGYQVEHGLGRDRDGAEIQARRPPWGPGGFWRGREIPEGLR
jgi:hypothetical protein